ncbi:MAG: iron ABC transporter permease [Proteobacteria bacterium]|nr:iron ABC transporter permease [Pseudomonadota bacterium]
MTVGTLTEWRTAVRFGLPNVWTLGALVAALFVALPIVAVVLLALGGDDGMWRHLTSTVLGLYIERTLVLMSGVGIGTFVIGTTTAWLVTMYRFPGRRIFEWALLLPLAVPSYILAFVVTDQLEYAGNVQTWLRAVFGWSRPQDYWFFEIRSMGGAITVMTLVLYPYVYLLARAAFLEQSVCVLEISRTLGNTAVKSFFRVALPLARPAIVVGVMLVLMETINDFGTVEFFAVQTFTAGIYDVWLNMSSISGAAQLSSVLLLIVLALIVTERWARQGRRFHHTSSKYSELPSYRLNRGWGWAATVFCALPVLLGFVLPAAVLAAYSARYFRATLSVDYAGFVINSLTLSAAAAAMALVLGVFLAYAVRLSKGRVVRIAARFASIGYAVPGAILAVGVLWPMGIADRIAVGAAEAFGFGIGAIFIGTIAPVIYGYLVRFLALSLGTAEASLGKVTPNMDGAARTLGMSPLRTLARLHFPLMRGSLATAAILVFVDCMKELPLTMILRPFNFDTLATFVYQYASDERLEASALGALTIVAAGVVPVLLLSVTIAKSRPGSSTGIGTTNPVAPT